MADIRIDIIKEVRELIVVGIAAMNLVMDFDFIESAAGRGARRLLSKTRSRR